MAVFSHLLMTGRWNNAISEYVQQQCSSINMTLENNNLPFTDNVQHPWCWMCSKMPSTEHCFITVKY